MIHLNTSLHLSYKSIYAYVYQVYLLSFDLYFADHPLLYKEHTLSTFIWLNKLNYVKFIMLHNK